MPFRAQFRRQRNLQRHACLHCRRENPPSTASPHPPRFRREMRRCSASGLRRAGARLELLRNSVDWPPETSTTVHASGNASATAGFSHDELRIVTVGNTGAGTGRRAAGRRCHRLLRQIRRSQLRANPRGALRTVKRSHRSPRRLGVIWIQAEDFQPATRHSNNSVRRTFPDRSVQARANPRQSGPDKFAPTTRRCPSVDS